MEIMIPLGYIVIGGGTARCALAARLSRPGQRHRSDLDRRGLYGEFAAAGSFYSLASSEPAIAAMSLASDVFG